MSNKNIENESRIFAPENAAPDSKFKKELWNRCESAYKGKNVNSSRSLINFFSLRFMSKPLKIAVMSVFGVLLLGGIGLVTYNYINGRNTLLTSDIAVLDTTKIFNEISRNNSSLNSRNNITNSSYRALATNQTFASQNAADSSKNLSSENWSDSQSGSVPTTDIMPIYNFNQVGVLYHTQSTVSAGPLYGACKYTIIDDLNPEDTSAKRTIDSYSYLIQTDPTYKTAQKQTVTDQNNVLRSYSMSDGSYTYTYAGGDFAIKQPIPSYGVPVPVLLESDTKVGDTVEERSQPDVASDTPTTGSATGTSGTTGVASSEINLIAPAPDQPLNVFGDTAKIVRVDQIDGRKYYVIDQSTFGYCDSMTEKDRAVTEIMKISPEVYSDDSVVSVNLNVPFVVRYWFDAETYKIAKSETYKDSVTNANLIYTESTTETSETGSFSKFSSIFTFTETNNVVSIGLFEATPKLTLFNTLVANKDFNFITPKTWKSELSEFYLPETAKEPMIEQLLKRSYYPNTDLGTKMYDQAVTSLSNGWNFISSYQGGKEFLSYTYTGSGSVNTSNLGSSSMRISLYDTTVTDDEILSAMYLNKAEARRSTVEFTINGVKTIANVYTVTSTSQSVPGYAGPSSSAGPSADVGESNTVNPGVVYEKSGSKNQYTVFTYNNVKYGIQGTAADNTALLATRPQFNALSVVDTSTGAKLKTIVNRFLTENQYDGVRPMMETAPAVGN